MEKFAIHVIYLKDQFENLFNQKQFIENFLERIVKEELQDNITVFLSENIKEKNYFLFYI